MSHCWLATLDSSRTFLREKATYPSFTAVTCILPKVSGISLLYPGVFAKRLADKADYFESASSLAYRYKTFKVDHAYQHGMPRKIPEASHRLFTRFSSEIRKGKPPPLPYVDSQQSPSHPAPDSHSLNNLKWRRPSPHICQHFIPSKG